MEILKMTDDLSGLSAELRKAAKTTEEISDLFVRNAGEGTQEKVFRLKWLPAVLVEKEMTDLSGLSVELRRAAKTTKGVQEELKALETMAYINRFNDYNNNAERNKQNLEDFKVRSWLPTDLVEKEMRRMKRVVDEMVVWHDAECRPNFKDMCSTCHVLKKIEGVLG